MTKDGIREYIGREKAVPPSTTDGTEDALADAFGCLRDGACTDYGCCDGADALGRAPKTTKDDGRQDVERDMAVAPSARTLENPAKESAPSMSPSPPIAEVDAATSTSTAGGVLAAARSMSPSSRRRIIPRRCNGGC